MGYFSIGLVYFFEYLITVSFCNRVMEKKNRYVRNQIIIFTLYVIGFAIYHTFQNLVLNLAVSLLIYLFTMLIGYKEKFCKQIVYTIYLAIMMYASEAIVIYFLNPKYQAITANNSMSEMQQLLASVATKIINFILIQILALIIQRRDFKDNKKLFPLFIYPVISFAFTLQFYSLASKYDYAKGEINTFIIISIIDAVMCIAIFMYYGLLDEKDRKLKEIEKEQQFVELNNSYMQVLEHQNNEMRMMFHDTKNHYNAIANMDSAEEIHSYVDALFDDIQKYQIIKLTNNKMLDLLLSKYKTVCSSKSISFNIEVKTADLDYIDDRDLSILVCNLLDNAVESAEHSAQKSIVFSLRRVNTFDVLNVINSCDTEPVIKGKIIKTSKVDKSAHGYGIKIISKNAKKNNAEYEWHYDSEAKKFSSTLIFKR